MPESSPRTSWPIPTLRSSRSRAPFTAAISSPPPPRISRRASRSSNSGPPVDPEGLIRLDLPAPAIDGRGIRATFLYVDSFGNIALNLDRDDVESLGIVSGTRVELELAGERYYAVMARTFADARPGDVILYEDSYKNMSLAISRGNAARMLHASPGQQVRISIAG